MEIDKKWQAQWIWHEGLPRTIAGQHELVYFRRVFEVPPAQHCQLVLDVSADSRYRLFLNGESIALGPCKGDGQTHYYETVDVTERLRPGKNVLAARVVHYVSPELLTRGSRGPVSVWHSALGAFLLEGNLIGRDGVVLERLATDQRWKCWPRGAFHLEGGRWGVLADGYEHVDGTLIPHGWEASEYIDTDWQNAVPFSAVEGARWGVLTPWQLAPRPIPFLFERARTFAGVTRLQSESHGATSAYETFCAGTAPLHLSAGERFVVELDAGELSTGYLRFECLGGRGSTVRLLCAECYEPEPGSSGERHKGVRDLVEGNVLVGDYDCYRIAGSGSVQRLEAYEPFWFRTFRFVRVEIEVGQEPLSVQRFSYRETGYPLDVRADFAASDPELRAVWEISLRTLQRCMHETYEDCPYYEQLQYEMDTRLQLLFTYNVSGDDRLARRALYDFHSALLPTGILRSNAPATDQQVIPGFALYWIFMLHDHYQYFGDAELVRRYRPSMDAILDWFERRITAAGLVGPMPARYWSYVDWVPEWVATDGVPPASSRGSLTVYNLMYATALQNAAELNAQTGRSDTAHEYRERAQRIKEMVSMHCWSGQRALFRDGPAVEEYSQHTQIWSVLSGAVSGTQAQKLIEETMADEQLTKVSYIMAFFLFRALAAVGRYERSFVLWERWRRFLALHLSTCPESEDAPRSDCHAWGAIPLYEFPAEILGVRPGAPGYARIIVAPQPGPLSWARGNVATARGLVTVDWHIDDERQFVIHITGPQDVALDLYLPDGSRQMFASANCHAHCRL